MKKIRILLPFLSLLATLFVHQLIPNSTVYPETKKPYFSYVLCIGFIIYAIFYIWSFWRISLKKKLLYYSYFIAGWVFILNVINIVTVKLALLPVLYFPALDRVFGTLVEERNLLLKCLVYSGRLLLTGYLIGAVIGILTGIAVGFHKKVSYWISPLVRVLGPIPSTAWIPIALVIFPDAITASSFLIALAVWFPTTLMTSSGIANISNAYFEVADTLGAKFSYKIWKVGVPAAMPHMFLGLFNGACSSFITLITAEMIGAKYGIGWYVNWQKEMLAYANVYAGLLVISTVFSVLITFLFRFRDKVLVWQKGVIKW